MNILKTLKAMLGIDDMEKLSNKDIEKIYKRNMYVQLRIQLDDATKALLDNFGITPLKEIPMPGPEIEKTLMPEDFEALKNQTKTLNFLILNNNIAVINKNKTLH